MIETLRIALFGLSANKLRSGLTILGLMIGVGSVIVLISVGTGSSAAIENQINDLGSNLLTISSAPTIGGLFSRGSSSSSTGLTMADATGLQNRFEAPDVKNVSPVVNASDVTMTYGSSTYTPASFVGTTPSYRLARDYTMAEGSFFTEAEVKSHARVVVVGPTEVQELWSGADPVGDTVQINGTDFEVIGVTASKGSNGTTDLDDIGMAPITAVQDTLTGFGDISQILVQANSTDALSAAQTEVTNILNQLSPATGSSGTSGTSGTSSLRSAFASLFGGRRSSGAATSTTSSASSSSSTTSSNFDVSNQSTVLQASTQSAHVFTTLLGEVAAISLLVGGIGVMNIMLVSVTERTREIGIRKAVGARRGDILIQFLVEAVLVSVFGGLAGVAAGVIGSQFRIAGVVPVIAPYSIFVAFGAAVLIGLFFGTYPAGRAAAMRPIEALRFE